MDKTWPKEAQKPLFEYSRKMDEDGTSLPSGRLSARVNTKRDLVSFEFNRSLFADDAAFIFLSRKGIEVGTAHINHAFRTFGLEVHLGTYHDADKKKERTTSKTEFMFIPANGEASPAETKADITVDGNRFVSYTDMFVYLGSRITHTLSDSTDLSARIGKGWGAFFKAKPVLLNKHINMDLRINLFKSLVLGQVLWGCESWALTGGDRDALDTFLHQALRSMFNLRMRYVKTHRITNTDLRARANIPTLNSTKQVRTLHQLRKDSLKEIDSLSRRILSCQAVRLPGHKLKRGGGPITTQGTMRADLEAAGLCPKGSGGDLAIWIPNLLGNPCQQIDEQLHLPEGTCRNGIKPTRKK